MYQLSNSYIDHNNDIALDLGRYLNKDTKQLSEDLLNLSDILNDGGVTTGRLIDSTANIDIHIPDPGSHFNLQPNTDEPEKSNSTSPGGINIISPYNFILDFGEYIYPSSPPPVPTL